MKRALFVELLGGIGDLVLALPAIEALAEAHPDREWDVLTFEPGSELIADDPRITRVHVAPRTRASRATSSRGFSSGEERPACWYTLDSLLKATDYDLVVTDTRHSRLHERIEAGNAQRVMTSLWEGAHAGEPIGQTFLRRLRDTGFLPADTPDRPPRVVQAPARRAEADQVWARLGVTPRQTVVLNPSAGMAIKRWPIDSFRRVARALRSDGWTVVILEGDTPGDALQIADGDEKILTLGRLPLGLTAACLVDVALFGSADTGLAHVAAAVGTPVVAVYGPTWSGRYGVQGVAQNLQSRVECPELHPMNFTLQRCWPTGRCIFSNRASCCDDVTPHEFLAAASAVLAGAPLRSSEGDSPADLTNPIRSGTRADSND